MNQTAGGKPSNYDRLVELLESIKHLLNRLDIYTRIPSTPATDEMISDIMVELLSTLALATKGLKQRRPSEFVLADVLPYSAQHSQTHKETLRKQGCRSGPAKAGSAHTGPGSNCRRSGSSGRSQCGPEYECGHGQ